jgi:DNA (cytosine-5)-methyltransferase 1
MKLIFVEILQDLKAAGYRVKAAKLNAMYFHVPQSRKRMIFIGIGQDQGIRPTMPKAEYVPISIEEAIDIPDETIGYITASNERHTLAGRLPIRQVNQPMATLVKTGNSRMMKPWHAQRITAIEAARFGSFPDSYQFVNSHDAIIQIGNSVPPLFMESIARHVRIEVLDKVTGLELELIS